MPGVAVKRSRREVVLKLLSAPRPNLEKIAYTVAEHGQLVSVLIESTGSDQVRRKFGAIKALWMVSERAPHLVYPHLERIERLLDSDNAILRWQATRIIANLAAVDHQERIEEMLDRYMDPITDREMVSAAICIQASAVIACAKPHLADRIARHILKVEHGIYKTPECRNVAIGHAITSFDQFYRELQSVREDVIDFIQRQLANTRASTRKKAEAFLKKWAT